MCGNDSTLHREARQGRRRRAPDLPICFSAHVAKDVGVPMMVYMNDESNSNLPPALAREAKTVETMIGIYCAGNHGRGKASLCADCAAVSPNVRMAYRVLHRTWVLVLWRPGERLLRRGRSCQANRHAASVKSIVTANPSAPPSAKSWPTPAHAWHSATPSKPSNTCCKIERKNSRSGRSYAFSSYFLTNSWMRSAH